MRPYTEGNLAVLELRKNRPATNYNIHCVVIFLVLVVLKSLVTLFVEQAALDLDAIGRIAIALKVEGVSIDSTALPRLVFHGVGDPYAHGPVSRRARVVLRVHDVEFFAHHGRIQGALDVAQLLVASHAITDADFFNTLRNVLVSWVLCDPAHLLAALGFGALLGLHVGVAVLLCGRVLRVHDGAWLAEKVIQVSPAYHDCWGARGEAARGSGARRGGNRAGSDVPGPRRAGVATLCCGG